MVLELPPSVGVLYRAATAKQIRNWSFGALKAARMRGAHSWSEVRSTLGDQAIFGPVADFACACGKYQTRRYEGLICDRCGVKVAPAAIRRSRFGHIELASPIQHPCADSELPIDAFPILPAAFVESASGERIANLYDTLVLANESKDPGGIANVVQQICENIRPILIEALSWNLQDVDALARGLGLIRKTATLADDECCRECGYPLTVLALAECPGCGKSIERS